MSDEVCKSPPWSADNSAVTAHINLLQVIINRLANNSASCKTWCLALVAALLSLAGATHVPEIVAFALLPVVIFGFMDTMYLAQEIAYRDLYETTVERIRNGKYGRDDVYEAHARVCFSHFCTAFASWSIFPVYLGLIIAYFIVVITGWLAVLTTVAKYPSSHGKPYEKNRANILLLAHGRIAKHEET